MGQDRARTAGEHGSHAATGRGEVGTPDDIDTGVNSEQPTVTRPSCDGRFTKAKRGELPGRNHAVLRLRELHDCRLAWKLST
jgi:hypothetical protein